MILGKPLEYQPRVHIHITSRNVKRMYNSRVSESLILAPAKGGIVFEVVRPDMRDYVR